MTSSSQATSGVLGKQIVLEQMKLDGFDLTGRYDDCGVMIFDSVRQDVHAGGSGCGCSASVLCGHLLRRMREGKLKRLLFCATGALFVPCFLVAGRVDSRRVPCRIDRFGKKVMGWTISRRLWSAGSFACSARFLIDKTKLTPARAFWYAMWCWASF